MTQFHKWGDIERELFTEEQLDRIRSGAARRAAAYRAARLVEMRKELGLTQVQMAERLHVRQERVSAIERGEVTKSEVGTVAAYIAALGGRLRLVADFDGVELQIT